MIGYEYVIPTVGGVLLGLVVAMIAFLLGNHKKLRADQQRIVRIEQHLAYLVSHCEQIAVSPADTENGIDEAWQKSIDDNRLGWR